MALNGQQPGEFARLSEDLGERQGIRNVKN